MSKLQEEFLQSAARLIIKIPDFGFTVTGGELWRTPQQAQWDADHHTGIVHSLHMDRLAIDLVFFAGGVLITDGSLLGPIAPVGEWWKKLGPAYRWGGDFVHIPADGGHFSISPDGVRA